MEGKRVKLLAVEGLPEEFGVCLSKKPDNGTIIVQLDEQYRLDGVNYVDDGVREVSLEHVEWI